ncbi:sterol desaturase family protein [bacterium SCSIO 12741]|nr:sterol desaturase family protein [bacterium SCSIO 12741]
MEKYWNIFVGGYKGYASYLWNEITHPGWHNYFYWLIGVSLFFMLLEWLRPWRKGQARFRKDFWLDAFYMFFNFFFFSLIIYNGFSDVVVNLFNDAILAVTSFNLQESNPMNQWPIWAVLLTGFVVRDFVQWWVHRLLHRVPALWEFHKVHHSVEQMGFAAHLRYHWMETLVYRSFEYLPLALLGIGLYDFFIIHIAALAIGHYNHANFRIKGTYSAGFLGVFVGFYIVHYTGMDWLNGGAWIIGIPLVFAFGLGPFMEYLFNSPQMHIWHHSYDLPEGKPHGINFGISLAIWDYIFGTASMPSDGRDIRLGFPGIEKFPQTFIGQFIYGFRK